MTGKRVALGAMVTVRSGSTRQSRAVISAYSFQAANEPVAHFGLGARTSVDAIEILWPDGARESFPTAGVDRRVTVTQGTGQ